MAAISQLLHNVRQQRITSNPAGEYVLPRGEITTQSVAVSGTLYMTHFTALETETIASIRTGMGGSGSVAVDTTHAWVGIASWDGTQYLPEAVSEDNTDLWATPDITYTSDLWDFDNPGVAGHEGWQKVAGRDYAFWVLWIGTGQTPALPARGGWYQDSLTDPRSNAFLLDQTDPPAGPLTGSFFGPDSRCFQGLLVRAS